MRNIGYLSIAIRRFNFAYKKDRLEDKWIDYLVSSESLYSETNESVEATHEISTNDFQP